MSSVRPAAVGRRPDGTGHPHPHGADGPLQLLLLALQLSCRGTLRPGALQAAGDLAVTSQVRLQLPVVGRAHRGYRERGGPPLLAPAEQAPRGSGLQADALGKRGEFEAMGGGLRAQLGRAKCEAVCMQNGETSTAGIEGTAGLAAQLGEKCFG